MTLLDLAESPDPPLPVDAIPQKIKVVKKSRTVLVAELFRACPGKWIDGLDIARVGGAYAWRTRVSECRAQFGMTIENREIKPRGGRIVSEYRFLPKAEQE